MPERDRRWRRNQYAKDLQKKQYRQRIVERKFHKKLREKQILEELEQQEKDFQSGYKVQEESD